jgi:ABC-2 type transport system permease protein
VQILTSKLLAALSSLLLTDLVISVASFAAIALFNGGRAYEVSTLVLVMFSGVILQLFFLCVGLVISLLVKRVRSVTPYSLGLGFGAYVLAAFSGVFGDVKLEYLTPFKHLDPAYIVQHAAYDTPLVLLNGSVTLIALAVSYWLYIRRDIHAVS